MSLSKFYNYSEAELLKDVKMCQICNSLFIGKSKFYCRECKGIGPRKLRKLLALSIPPNDELAKANSIVGH